MTDAPLRPGQASDGPCRASSSLRDDPARSEAALTVKQYEALVALATTGSYKAAAGLIGISVMSLNHRLTLAYEALGVSGQAKGSSILAFRALGWLRVPGEREFRNIVRVLLAGAA